MNGASVSVAHRPGPGEHERDGGEDLGRVERMADEAIRSARHEAACLGNDAQAAAQVEQAVDAERERAERQRDRRVTDEQPAGSSSTGHRERSDHEEHRRPHQTCGARDHRAPSRARGRGRTR